MAAYYSEHDPHAAEWLRTLIRAGLIPDGEVDERDIQHVTPAELVRFTQCHFFAGIGIWPLALRRAGWRDEWPIWTGSCPCQPFSGTGAGAGFDDERHLWPHWHWLIQNRRPRIFLGEQVSGKDGLGWLDLVSNDLGGIAYALGAVDLCAAGFGVGWRGSAESERLERAIFDCPDPMVARHMADFARWADEALAIGGFHIRSRLYIVGLADPDGDDFGAGLCGEGSAEHWLAELAHGSGALGLANSAGGGCGERGDALVAGEGGHADSGRHAFGRLADSDDDRRGAAGLARRGSAEHDDQSRGPVDRLVDGERSGSQGQRGHGDDRDQPGWIGAQASRSAPTAGGVGGLDNGISERRGEGRNGDHAGHVGFEPGPDGEGSGRADASDVIGGNADWLLCRDGYWRPARPGSFPLAHAAPARVGRLRAYGNGLDLETATAFATCVMGMLGDLIRASISDKPGNNI